MSAVTHLVQSGPLLLALPIAAAAGAVTFLSPCCLPLVPGYLSFVTGMADGGSVSPAPAAPETADAANESASPGRRVSLAVAAPPARVAAPPARVAAPPARGAASPVPPAPPPRSRMVAGTALFVLGFSLVFIAYGAVFGSLGHLLTGHARGVTRALGVVTILLGLLFAGAFDRFSFAGRIVKPSARPKAGLAGAPLLGVMFGLGWTPCIGPTLGTVDLLSTATGTAARGAVLAFVYALGLGIPFLLMSFGFQRAMRAFAFARRHARLVTRIGGAMLICVGLLEVTGAWFTFITWLQTHWTDYQPPL